MIESSPKSAPSPAPLIGSEDILDSYLREIRDTPLLSGPEQRRLCEQMESAERRFREAIVSIPATARHVVALWRERRESGRVSGALSRFHRDGSGRDWSRAIDEKLGVVERDLAELAALQAARAPREALHARRDTLACHLEEAEIALPCLIGMIEPLEHAATREMIAEAGGRALFRRRLAAARDGLAALTDSKSRFITHNLRLVIRCAKSYRNRGVPFLDLIQEGNTGLIRAVEKFDHRRGYQFSTYAVWWIEQALIRAVAGDSRLVRVPSPILDQQRRLKRIEASLRASSVGEPSEFELAQRVAASREDMDDLRRSFVGELSCQTPIGGSDSLTVEETLIGEEAEDVGDAFDRRALRVRIRHLMPTLAERERRVLEWRFGLGGRRIHTLAEVGRKLGVSRERARQIEREALEQLKHERIAQDLAKELCLQ